MQFFPVALILSLAAAVQAVVHVIEVGNAQGQTIYNPNNIVSVQLPSIGRGPANTILCDYRKLAGVTSSCSSSTKRTTLQRRPLSMSLAHR